MPPRFSLNMDLTLGLNAPEILRSLNRCWYQAQALCRRPTIVHTKQNMCHVPCAQNRFCFVLFLFQHYYDVGTVCLWAHFGVTGLSPPFPPPWLCFRKWLILELSGKSPSVSPSISSAFTPYRLFQCYLQSKQILSNLGMKCWNSAFNAQGSRVIKIVCLCSSSAGALTKKETQVKLSLPPKLMEKLVWVPVISFCKIFIPSYAFDAL
jgi:hypothetical protein